MNTQVDKATNSNKSPNIIVLSNSNKTSNNNAYNTTNIKTNENNKLQTQSATIKKLVAKTNFTTSAPKIVTIDLNELDKKNSSRKISPMHKKLYESTMFNSQFTTKTEIPKTHPSYQKDKVPVKKLDSCFDKKLKFFNENHFDFKWKLPNKAK